MPSSHIFGNASANITGSGNPVTGSMTVMDGDTVLGLVICVGSATLRTGGAPTFQGRAFTQRDQTRQAAASPETSVEIWELLNPPVGAGTVSIPNAGSLTLHCRAASARSSTGASEFNAGNGATGTSTNPAASVTTTTDGCFILAIVGSGAQTWAPSARTGVQIHDTDHGAFGSGAQYVLQNTAGAQSMGWTFATSEDWAVTVAAWAPAKGPMRLNNYQQVSAGDGMSVAEKIR